MSDDIAIAWREAVKHCWEWCPSDDHHEATCGDKRADLFRMVIAEWATTADEVREPCDCCEKNLPCEVSPTGMRACVCCAGQGYIARPAMVTTAIALKEPPVSLREAKVCLLWTKTAVTGRNISYLLRALRTALDAASVVGACGIESKPHALDQDACVGWAAEDHAATHHSGVAADAFEPEPSFDPDGPAPTEGQPAGGPT